MATAPIQTPLPEEPSRDYFTKAQWDVLTALFDGTLPSIVPASDATQDDAAAAVTMPDDEFKASVDSLARSGGAAVTREAVAAFLKRRSSQDDEFQRACNRLLSSNPQREQLGQALTMLGTHLGSMLLTGYWTPIDQQSTRVREAIIKGWATSRFHTLRVLAKSITMLAQSCDCMMNYDFCKLTGYTDVPGNWKPVQGYDFKFLQPSLPAASGSQEEPHVITTDVVVVGSGCGGGVCAKNLAEAGHRVLVVDKGYYFPPSHLPMTQPSGLNYLFDSGGVYVTVKSGANIVCGGSWGGGGAVNWSVCLKLQDFVREEWAAGGQLPFFTSSDFDKCSDRVLGFVGAGTSAIRHNHRNRVLLDGAQKLGWKSGDAPQNTAGKEHYCGQCHLGCGSGEKQSPGVAWLPAAAEAGGAQFMEGMQVDKVLFADDDKTAIGIEGTWTSRDANGGVSTPLSERSQRRVVVKAKRVIISSGSLWSPLILMSSGIKNRHLGQNLHIHPCNFVFGTYDEETRPWEGGIITSYSSEFENLDGKGHGVKLEPVCMVPYTALTGRPWVSGLDSKVEMLKYGHTAGFISLTRDRDTGRVYANTESGAPVVDYTPSNFDAEHTLEGVQALAKICYVTGAKEIRVQLPDVEPFRPQREQGKAQAEGKSSDPEFTDPAFAAWLGTVRKAGNKAPLAVWSSAHQMGTCRMSGTSDDGVVDGKGKVWGKENLYVADASVFPSASGVNPMATVLTVADWISRGVDQGLRG